MKMLKYIVPAFAGLSLLTACNDDIENIPMQEFNDPYTYSELYYQNLRDFKATKHEISFGWFADYGTPSSMGRSFLGLPDSLDICSLWGGIPSDPKVLEDMRFVQKKKGTKMLVVAITRIAAELDHLPHKQAYLEAIKLSGDERQEAMEKVLEMYAEYFVDQVFLNDLDGFDADNEPEGDPNSGSNFTHFYKHLALYMGPNPDQTKEERLALIRERYGDEMAAKPGICDKLLCVDGGGPSDVEPYSNYWFRQDYGGGSSFSSGWPYSKQVFCCNVGDNWGTPLDEMYRQARAKAPDGGLKGGFGAFYIHRNYRITATNIEPYWHFRQCIQIQNPAIY